jgi:hypothetical protein
VNLPIIPQFSAPESSNGLVSSPGIIFRRNSGWALKRPVAGTRARIHRSSRRDLGPESSDNRQVGNSDQCHRCTIRDIVTIVIITTNSMIMTTATPTTTRKAIPA